MPGISLSKSFTVKIAAASSSKTASALVKTYAAKLVSIANAYKTYTKANTTSSSSSSVMARTFDAAPTATPEANTSHGSAGAYRTTELKVISEVLWQGAERDEDLVGVKVGTPITFEIGEWARADGTPVEVSDILVFIDETPNDSITVSDGIFTIPAELVTDDFKVQVTAMDGDTEIESAEIYLAVEN